MDLLSKGIVEQVREKAQARSAEQIAKGVMSKDTKQAISESTATMNRMRQAMQDVVAKTISERTPDNIPSRVSEPVLEGAPEKPEMGSREPYELEVDTIGNEALDSSGKTEMSKEEADYETGKKLREEALKNQSIMSKPIDDSADGVQPTDGKDFETRLEERLVELEGFRAEPYKPDEDEEFLTIGYGHYGSDVKKGTVITEAEARDLLRKDINKRMPQIKKAIKNFDSLSDDLKVEIAQSWFRGGISGSPKTIKLINEGKFTEASAEFLDNEEYRTTELGGVKTRMEALSNALKAEAA